MKQSIWPVVLAVVAGAGLTVVSASLGYPLLAVIAFVCTVVNSVTLWVRYMLNRESER